MQHKKHPLSYEIPLIAVLVLVQIGLVLWYLHRTGQVFQFQTGVTVISLDQSREPGRLSPYGPGFERELVDSFARESDLAVRRNEADTWQEAREKLLNGRGDLLIAPGVPPISWPIDGLAAGPVYLDSPSLLVHHTQRFGLRSIYDLCQVPLNVPAIPALNSLVFDAEVEIPCRPEVVTRGGGGVQSLLEFMEAEEARFALVDKHRFQAWAPFYPEVRQTYTFPDQASLGYRWYWATDRPEVSQALNAFWERPEQATVLAQLRERYAGFFPAQPDYYELRHLSKVLRNRLQRYLPTIRQAAEENGLDPLWLVAMIYQESHFDPQATSHTGVRGLMQITRNTARELGIDNRLDPEQSILGGARYVKYLWERFEGQGLEAWDRWFMALAAYNQGYNHARDAMRLTEQLGKDPHFWGDIKSVFPLLSYSRYHSRVEAGYARGFEAVDYVQSIRLYYYILHGFVSLSRPESEYLAPLLGLVPRGWPG